MQHIPHAFIGDQAFINGFQLKQEIHSILKQQNLRNLGSSSTAVDQASILLQYNDLRDPPDEDVLTKIETYRNSLSNEMRENACRNLNIWYLSWMQIFEKKFDQTIQKLTKDLFGIDITNEFLVKQHRKGLTNVAVLKWLILSLVGVPMPENLAHKIRLVIDFYKQYRHMINVENVEKRKSDAKNGEKVSEDCDVVIGFELKFWPRVALNRLAYLKRHNKRVYNIVKNSPVYIIPKSSERNVSRYEASFDFRFSFSAAEEKLAQSRSKIENKLNEVARKVYYLYLRQNESKHDHYIRSYFIKTCILWLCEQNQLDQIKLTNDDELTRILTKLFVEFARTKLKDRLCPHYFIENLNILAYYDDCVIQLAYEALESVDIVQKIDDIDTFEWFEVFKFCPDMVRCYRKFQMDNFNDHSSIYIADKYDSSLRLLLLGFYILENNNPNWWDQWCDTILISTSVTEAMNIDQLSISDIVIIVLDLFYAIQRMWPFFRYILTEDEIVQRYARKQRTLINYAIRICEKWMYDAQLNSLMGQPRTKEIKCGQDAKKNSSD
ncbi:unnamed protein product [Didymodactylos carnosus]|uniref:Mab-21-like HhH/H2TH-like domain-containing protein n=2 Tax=Didymodactylos carnosus TaxID=1234261 RepID=A0A816BZJ0_9BILA|nr:unnamed protein product [Didymodactylos carnosus]CAF4501309.1 unnamed protein product [Didymodactylos carnosus]